jgi:Putative RNA methylase family UPF0020
VSERRTPQALAEAVRAAGFTPRADEAEALVSLATADPDAIPAVARALGQLGERALPPLRAGFDDPTVVKLAGRLVEKLPALEADLATLLAHPDAKVRRVAVHAAGRTGPALEAPLLARLTAEVPPAEHAAIIEALGKIGGPAAHAALQALPESDARATALLRLGRTISRGADSEVLLDIAPPHAFEVELTCRLGLESILAEELGTKPSFPGRVRLLLDRPLASLFRARTWMRIEIPLGPPDDLPALLAANYHIMRALTRGPVRYRLEWLGAGPRRAATRDIALRTAALQPGLENDPSETTWDVLVSSKRVALAPRRFVDPRFSWRAADVPAASHPTVAAALARVAGVRADDIVWDPFVGSGGELVERALLGPVAALHGTDLDPHALAAAHENLAAAKRTATLTQGDARHAHPSRITLLLTNPPLGHRVAAPSGLLEDVLGVAARILTPDGRMVWISPAPDVTVATAQRLGLRVTYRQAIDLGGLRGEIQRFTPLSTSRSPGSRR